MNFQTDKFSVSHTKSSVQNTDNQRDRPAHAFGVVSRFWATKEEEHVEYSNCVNYHDSLFQHLIAQAI